MEVKFEWNVMSQEDAMIMALAGMLKQKVKYEELEPEKNNNGQGKSNVENNQSGTKRKKRYETPKWKLVAPKDGEPKEKEVDCTKF